MNTMIAGLIPKPLIQLASAQWRTAQIVGLLLTGSVALAAPDEWPDMDFYQPGTAMFDPGARGVMADESAAASSLSCTPSMQISLNQQGSAIVTPGMLVPDPDYPLNMYSVDINGPLTNMVYCAQIGTPVMATVTELPTGNTCWSNLTVEDKLKPTMVCTNDTIPCYTDVFQLDFMSFLDTVYDNCDTDVEVYYLYEFTELECDPDGIAGFVEIVYVAEDDYGNVAQCDQLIVLQKFPLDSIAFPPDTMVSCINPQTEPEFTGEPTLAGGPVSYLCEIIAWHEDTPPLPLCNGEYEIVRTWMVMDWCTFETISAPQKIRVKDTVPPDLTCPADITMGTDFNECFKSYVLPDPGATDICSDDNLIIEKYTISTIPGMHNPGEVVELDPGVHLLTISATDACGNTATCSYTITVVDDQAPVVACNNFSTNLSPMGMSFLQANSIQFFVEDNCEIDSIAIRRMTDNCDQPQDTVFGPSVKFCCADVGIPVMVSFIAIDAAGNAASCMIEVEVKDVDPPDAQCQDIMAFLDETGNVTIDPLDIDNGSTDNCGIVDRTVDPNAFDCDDLGNQVVTLTVTDIAGNTGTCTATVQVKDTIPPDAVCADITVMLDQMGMVEITPIMVSNGSSDNCGIVSYEVIPSMFDCDDVGDNVVLLIVEDAAGNADTCEAIVTVEENPPTVECMDATVYLDSNGEATVTADDVDAAMDDCGVVSRVVDPDMFDCSNVGPNIVTLTATDTDGNTATCTATVTVIDSLPPECLTMNITVQLDASGMASIDSNAVDDGSNDECGLAEITVTPADFDCEDVGLVVVIQTVTDVNGNTSTCSANVTVEDNVAPLCQTQDITVQLDANGMASIDSNAVDNGSSDACGLDVIRVSPDNFDCADVGTVIVTQTVTDVNGNISTCTATVTVEDNVAPTCQTMDITVQLDANGMASIDSNAVDNGSDDACGVASIEVTPNAFDCGDVGTVIVTQTVTDVNGNSSTCTATVTVEDNIDPICMAMDITVQLDANGEAVIDSNALDNGSSDACGLSEINVDQNMFDCDDVGVPVVVTQTVTDNNGNMSTCTATVTVQDTIAPNAWCMDITVYVDATGNVSITPEDVDAGSFVNCGEVNLSVDPMDFDCDDIGPNLVTLTVDDGGGNTASCFAVVTVLDTLPPTSPTMDITVYLDAMGMASIDSNAVDAGADDNCEVIEITVVPDDFDCSDVGPNPVVQTVTDVNGNTASNGAIVTVLDTIAPVCNAQDITVLLDGSGNATITAADVDNGSTDNCPGFTLSVTPSMFTCDDVGPNVVTLTVTDASGNISSCTATVTVVDDDNLVAICQDLTINLDANGMASITPEQVDNGSGGGCSAGDITLSLDQEDFDCTDVGPNVVTLTVTDSQGNTATCTATITVVDNMPPDLVCPPNVTVNCDEVDPNDLSEFGVATADDNCPNVMINENVVFNLDVCGVGSITRTFTATDASGNTDQCVQIITVENPDPFTESDIIWPDPVINLPECSSTDPDDIPDSQPEIVLAAESCSNVSISFSDMVTMTCDTLPSTPCIVVERTWTVIDSCQLPGGVFTFEQTINVQDSVGPVFSVLADVTVNADPATCSAFVMLEAFALDCGAAAVITNDYNSGGGIASDTFPIGTTTVTFTAEDMCCNISTLEVDVTVVEANPAEVQCDKVIFEMPEELVFEVPAADFVTFLPGTCLTEADFFFSYSPDDISDSIGLFDCSFAGTVTPIEIYTFDMNMMPYDTCTAQLDLRDSMNFCGQNLTIGGEIFTESGVMLGQVPVEISEPSMPATMTSDEGWYVFTGLDTGGQYMITPVRDDNPKEGVSTLDLIAIQKHLLGIRYLDSPYKLIAADATNNGVISASDLLEVRKLLLGAIPTFSNNTSWRFVDAQFAFPDPYDPFMTPLPEEMMVTDMDHHMTGVDFVGVKIGDVNNTVSSIQSEVIDVRSAQRVLLRMPDQAFDHGERISVPVEVVQFAGTAGYQFALRFDPGTASLMTVTFPDGSMLDASWFGLDEAARGLIRTNWHAPHGIDLPTGTVLFELEFMTHRSGDIGGLLSLDDEALRAEGYADAGSIRPVGLDLYISDAPAGVFELGQNRPNPFAGTTEIPLYLPQDETVELAIYDLQGRLVYRDRTTYSRGHQVMEISAEILSGEGMYYYTVSTSTHRATRKMMVLK
ncbi:MAG: T9SS type A sorting domain-containing protein [Saprospiraceae bacterium]|nr:T9SS type A sorting domain-containing protein [Saprospiraceae bacterium]